MRDYTLAIGNGAPYGFSAGDDRGAALHVLDYVMQHAPSQPSKPLPIVLIGPDGLLSRPDEDATAFCHRIQSAHFSENTDDIRVADPTPPDCNTS